MKSTSKILAAMGLAFTLIAVGPLPFAAANETATTADPASSTAVTLPSDTTSSTGDQSFFEKVGDFASDNATWFIIGIIALVVILAAIFILRGRKKAPATPAAASKPTPGKAGPAAAGRAGAAAAGASAKGGGRKPTSDAPSAAEIKRRRRAAMQRAREEERLRRKAGLPAGAKPAQALDPVAAEKQAAKTGAPQPATAPVPPVSSEAPTEVSPAPGGVGAGAAVGGAAAAAAAAGALGSRKQDEDAEARLREKVEEIKAGQAATAPPSEPPVTPPVEQPTAVTPPPGAPVGLAGGAAAAAAGAAAAGAIGSRGEVSGEVQPPLTSQAVPVPQDLAEAEQRIRADREVRDRTLAEAEERLRLVEERAAAAERRAAFAEQLAELKAEEGEQERRLREVMERMDRAEERARQAELRAESAERVASDALRGGGVPTAAPLSAQPPSPPAGLGGDARAVAPAPVPAGPVNINTASFEELRGADFSVTQATRVLAYRERFGGYSSVDDLARVPGFSPEAIAALRDRVSI